MVKRKPNLMHNLFFVYFVNLYMFSGISRPIIRRYKHMYTTVVAYYSFWMTVCCPGWIPIQSGQQRVIKKE